MLTLTRNVMTCYRNVVRQPDLLQNGLTWKDPGRAALYTPSRCVRDTKKSPEVRNKEIFCINKTSCISILAMDRYSFDANVNWWKSILTAVNMGSDSRPEAKQLSYTNGHYTPDFSVAFVSERKRALWDSFILAMGYTVNNVYYFL